MFDFAFLKMCQVYKECIHEEKIDLEDLTDLLPKDGAEKLTRRSRRTKILVHPLLTLGLGVSFIKITLSVWFSLSGSVMIGILEMLFQKKNHGERKKIDT